MTKNVLDPIVWKRIVLLAKLLRKIHCIRFDQFMFFPAKMASHKQNTYTTDTARKTSTLKQTKLSTQQQNSTTGDYCFLFFRVKS